MSEENDEHRSLERLDVPQLVVVYDQIHERELGTIVNMHEEGFMLIGEEDLGEDGVFQMRFEFAEPVRGVNQLVIGAECLWTNETGVGDKLWAGFHIIDISGEDKRVIADLVKQIG